MRGLADVFMLELRMRKAVFPAALVAGLVPIPLALMMKGVASFPDALNVGAYAFALIGGELLALYLGATVLCQDLSEGRLGFYFAKPISGWALWAGKLLAAWLVVLGAMLVTILPATLFGEGLARIASQENPFWTFDLGPQTVSPLWTLLFAALAVLFFIAFAHALSVMFRARSPWLILDAVMVVLVPALGWLGLRRVTEENLQFVMLIATVAWTGSLLVILLPAGALQAALGRCDLRRGHKILSLTLWSSTSVAVLLVSAYILWATGVSPSGLKSISYVVPAPEGPWISVGGPGRGLGPYSAPTFLLNTQSGAWTRVSMNMWSRLPLYSPDGKMAVLVRRPLSDGEPGEVVSFDLTASGSPAAQHHGLFFQGWSADISFSPDSSRLAIFHNLELDVYDLPSWNLVGARKIEPARAGYPMFLNRGLIRIYQLQDPPPGGKPGVGTLSILEWDLAKKTFETTGKIEEEKHWARRMSPDRMKMLLVQEVDDTSRLLLCDARTGAVIKSLCEGVGAKRGGTFLQDGRIVATERKGEERILRVFSPEGDELKGVRWGPGKGRAISFGGEPSPGKVLLESWIRGKDRWVTHEVYLWDVDTGDVRLLPGLHRPWDGGWFWGGQEGVTSPKSAGAGLFLDEKGKLVRFDFATGKSEVVKMGS